MNQQRTILSNYFGILEEDFDSNFVLSKCIPVSFDIDDSYDKLWKIHNSALKNYKISDVKPNQSLMDIKIELSSRIFKNCSFCERKCNIDRFEETGYCGVKKPRVASEFLHLGEESVLIPSHTIFFSGCTFECVFCQNWDISQNNTGSYIEPSFLADIIKTRKAQGSKNVNWVGGDPTSNLLFILKTLNNLDINISQVWNSNMYCSSKCMDLLSGIIDVYLTDFKYGNDACARRLSKVDDYSEIVRRNHRKAYDDGEMIIRHLVLPGHVECCSKPIIRWIAENIPNTLVNIMGQYHPCYMAEDYEDISKSVSAEEVSQVKKYAAKYGINQI